MIIPSIPQNSCAVVWLKRDLRLSDHQPLQRAIQSGLPVLILHCFEPSWMQSPDSSDRHWRFVHQSITEMQCLLSERGIPLYSFYGELLAVLEAIKAVFSIKKLYSYQETGNLITYERDKAVARYCAQEGITWHESPTNGVQRRLYNRKNWDTRYQQLLEQPTDDPDWPALVPAILPDGFGAEWSIRQLPAAVLSNDPAMQPGGTHAGRRYLDSFLATRSQNYFKHISKPEAARYSCSRISPYITWGNLSVRQVYQQTRQWMARHGNQRNLEQFLSRLYWQSHFIQKFETECRMEFENLNPGFDHLRTHPDPVAVQAWAQGRTGFPLVDAAMRSVIATGYLNFRMRAMLVSFLTHHLWQPGRWAFTTWRSSSSIMNREFIFPNSRCRPA